MKKFEIGKTYACSSICNSECVWTFTVIRRPAQRIQETRRRIKEKLKRPAR